MSAKFRIFAVGGEYVGWFVEAPDGTRYWRSTWAAAIELFDYRLRLLRQLEVAR